MSWIPLSRDYTVHMSSDCVLWPTMALCNVFTVRSKGSEVIIVFVEVSDTKIMLKGYSRARHVLASSYDYSVLLLSVPHADIHTCTAALALVHAQTHVRTDTHTHTRSMYHPRSCWFDELYYCCGKIRYPLAHTQTHTHTHTHTLGTHMHTHVCT